MNAIKSSFPSEVYTEMLVDEKAIKFQVDSGASANILSTKHIGEDGVTPTGHVLRMWNGAEVRPLGTRRLVLRNPKNNKRFSVEFVVVREDLTPLLGARAAQHMGIISIHDENFKISPSPRKYQPEVKSITSSEALIEQFADVFDRKLGTLAGTVHLEVDTTVKPVITPTRRVPVALKSRLQEELKKYEEQGILAPVEEPTPWVSSMVIATKKSGDLRLCIDPRPLNKALRRETLQMPVLDELLPELTQAKVFSTVDLRSGFWHCTLDEESSRLTTFATPFGRYRWRRLPFGLSVSSEIFQKRVNQATEGLSGVLGITDDILVFGKGETVKEAEADHDKNLHALLERCRERGIALNKEKLKLKRDEVPFMGHVFTRNGLKVDPGKVKAVTNMPRPEDVEGVQRLNGFVNYLAKFLPQLSSVMAPIRRLTRKDSQWQWAEEQEKALEEIKRLVTTAPVLGYYDPTSELEIQCDASQTGLGATIMQGGRPIAYASRSLTDTETRYAQIEKEMLAIVFALEKFHQYTFGRHVRVQSDHKPLESIITKPLSCAPRRLQGMMMRIQKYNIEVVYRRGQDMHIADTLSRAYLPAEANERRTGQSDFEQINMAELLPITDERLKEIRQATACDESLQTLKTVILEGWPESKQETPSQAAQYFTMRDELSVQDGLIFKGQRVIIPFTLRPMIKQRIHSSHMGTESCLRRARECVYWHGMSADIKQLVEACETCRKFDRAQQNESLRPHEVPSRPWQAVGVDLFEHDEKHYLITVDYYSNYWKIDRLTSTKASMVISKLKNHFARYGCPDKVVSDNGPQFDCGEFAQFAHAWEFEHTPISPRNSKANGKAEAAVGTAKALLRKALESKTDFYLAVLDYRNTPTQGVESSPAQRLMNRRTKTLLPTAGSLLRPDVVSQEKTKSELKRRQEQQGKHYNKTAKDLAPLHEGDVVRMKPFRAGERVWRKAIVTDKLDDRSYNIEAEDGGKYRRNRSHLRKTKEPATAEHQPAAEEAATARPHEAESVAEESATAAADESTPGPPCSSRPTRIRRAPTYLDDYVWKQ